MIGKNMGRLDRTLRFALGGVLVPISLFGLSGLHTVRDLDPRKGETFDGDAHRVTKKARSH